MVDCVDKEAERSPVFSLHVQENLNDRIYYLRCSMFINKSNSKIITFRCCNGSYRATESVTDKKEVSTGCKHT